MNKKIGFIGCGNMAGAIIGGIIKSGLVEPECIMASDLNVEKLQNMKKEKGISVTNDNKEAAQFADILILSVKPNMYSKIIDEIKDTVKKDVIIVTIAAGIKIKTTENAFGKDVKVVRVMPNTPALVGEGMAALSNNSFVSKEEMDIVVDIFKSFGEAEIIDEKYMEAVTAVSGSSPAYTFMYIEALADGAVLQGIQRDKAYKMAAQAVLGAAKMVLETGKHPGELKDAVCSPSGTTIEAVYSLEKNNFRGSVIEAIEICANKAKAMSKE